MGEKVVVTGAGGFIGHHLVTYLKEKGYWVRGVDIKRPEFEKTCADEFLILDLRFPINAMNAVVDMDYVCGLAADMGGMGFMFFNDAQIIYNNTMINFNTLEAARICGVKRYFFSSSACVYPVYMQQDEHNVGLRESDVYPANPQGMYGWEKLHMEHLCRSYVEDFDMSIGVARFHNTYGPLGTWCGGREKVPAALCRKVALGKLLRPYNGRRELPIEVDIWGDGEQTRTFVYVDDTVEGIYRIMMSDYLAPLNVGSTRMISINTLLDLITEAAGVDVVPVHVKGPVGVRGRNSNNALSKAILDGWEPMVSLEDGISKTYQWIEAQVKQYVDDYGVEALYEL